MEFETNERMDGLTPRLFVRPSSVSPFVRLSFCPLCLSGASILWGNDGHQLLGM